MCFKEIECVKKVISSFLSAVGGRKIRTDTHWRRPVHVSGSSAF